MPGSRWLYIKLYTGEKTADELLIQIIAPVVKRLQKTQSFEKWFFIRYSDPDFHLRIRFLTSEVQVIGEIIDLFHRKLERWNKDRLLWKMQLDTYNRELERYGNELIEEAESVFYADSECILSILKKLNNNEKYRWMIALKLIDGLLSDFHLTLEEKQKLMGNFSQSYKTEFGFNEYNAKQFNTKFRENKSIVESILNDTFDESAFTSLSISIKKRTKTIAPVVEQIKMKLKKDSNLNDLIQSYIHMMLNRLFSSKNRLHELVLYDFMFRYYTSKVAQLKHSKK
jgi:thiopeptide-type bacteriocin biosynthesis protein